MISFWENESLLKSDVIIIGGGIVGMSVAASIAERDPNQHILILERSIFPFGASTRNAGFACFGSLTEILSDIRSMGEDDARELLFQRWMGLQITRKRLSDKAIGFQDLGGYELIHEKDEALSQLQRVNALVEDFIPNYISEATSKQQTFNLKATNHTMVSMAQEGQVHTGKLMKSLQQYVQKLGIEIRTGVEVKAVKNGGKQVLVNDQFRGEMSLSTTKTIVCTNAFSASLFKTDLKPGRGQVFITKPIQHLSFQGNLHLDEGFYYLRSVGDRLMFGGARNRAFDEEETTSIELNQEIQLHLEDYLKKLFGYKTLEVEMRWAGIMAFGNDKKPIVKQLEESTYAAIKMGGMGIALAGFIGEEVADLIVQ